MKIVVTVKRTPHRDARIRVAGGGERLELEGVAHEVNYFDAIAVEEALKLRESAGGEVVVVTVGPEPCQQQLIAALAMGADRGVRVDDSVADDSLRTARLLRAVVEREAPDLVLAGKLAIDDEAGQVPSMLAALLGWPQASQASALSLVDGGGAVRVETEVDDGLEVVELGLPALVTVDLRLNEPRYASLPGIMKAKRKPAEVLAAADLVAPEHLGAQGSRTRSFRPLPPRSAGVRVADVDELVRSLAERRLV